MRESLNDSCILFINNRDAFKAAFPFEHSMLFPICASILTDENKVADIDSLKETRKMLKSRVGVFSNFRSSCELPILAMLDVDSDPDWRLDKTIEVYNSLKDHFFSSEYLPLAAMTITRGASREEYAEICERTRRIYDLMKKEHPFLTSSEDCVFAAMLALSEKIDNTLIKEIELCYEMLEDKFRDRNALQSLSHVLTLSGEEFATPSDKCRNTVRLFDILKEKKYKYGTACELSALGVLANLPCGIEEVARDLIDVAEFLKAQKGYGAFGFDKKQRLFHAAMIVTSDRVGGSSAMSGAAVGSTVAMMAAQQAALCAAIAVGITAANAAHSSH